MSKSLVIVESPSKVKSIQKYLGKDYTVASSKGHIVDLPKSELGVDVDKNYKPKYVVTKSKALKDLKKAFEGKDTLILAVDPDREGEAIGWHVAQKLGVITPKGKIKDGMKLERIVFTSITKDAVKDAIKKPRKLDMNLVDAQQARRILDRLVGYKLSPLLWKKIRFGLSAGRVQSVAVRLVVEREEERDAFNAEEYWSINADLSEEKIKGDPEVQINIKKEVLESGDEKVKKEDSEEYITFGLSKINGKKAVLPNQKDTKKIIDDVKKSEWKISGIKAKKAVRNSKPPFTTSTLQQTASSWFGYSPKKTMMIAQKLYEQGHITYMRTDSTNLAPDAVGDIRKYIKKDLGAKYLPGSAKAYKTKAKVAQEAHEAIRPSQVTNRPGELKLKEEHKKLYALIWQRTVASQMASAELENGKIEVEVGKYLFAANGQKILFDGYLKVYPEKVGENLLPELNEGDILNLARILGNQHFTQPPARYSEASLIKALESYGIGRPSTYVPILSTIQTRKYVEKLGRYFIPTDTGIIVTRLLTDHFDNVVNYEFTAGIEGKLDDIANGDEDWVKMMGDFYVPFDKNIQEKDKTIDRTAYTVIGDGPANIKCPDCKGKMDIKLGRFGKFYSCKKWPDCKGMLSMEGKSKEDIEKEGVGKAFLSTYKPSPKTEDDRPFLLREGRYGKFWAHPDYPKVKDARPLEYTDEVFEKIYGKAPKSEDGTDMILRKGRFGEFWAHKDYPEKKEVSKLDKKEVKMKKEELGVA